jgi:phosphoglycerate dehydrogenase-like enzyme
MMMKCLYAGWVPPAGTLVEMLRLRGIELVVEAKDRRSTEAELIELVVDADATIVGGDRYTRRVIDSAEKLKIIARAGVGYDNVDVDAATEKGVQLTITPIPELANAMAEHTLGLILSSVKRIPQRNAELRAGNWDTKLRSEMDDLYHLTLGILGAGRIGAAVAKRAKAFEMQIIYHDVVRRTDLESALGIKYVSFDELLSQSDILSLHVPLNPQTRNIIDRAALGRMKRTATLVNTSRGAIVEEAALADVLRRGELAAACLDVFTQEPISPEHMFYSLGKAIPNLIMTPHAGEGPHTLRAMYRAAAEEVVRVLEGGAPRYPVNSIPTG